MKKSLLALAVLGAFASAAQAQSSVTIYGVVDAGVRYKNNLSNGTAYGKRFELGSGLLASNRLGFRGVEDLGGGLNARFNLEMGFDSSTGTGTSSIFSPTGSLFDRTASVGIGGAWGGIDLGLQYSVAFKTLGAIDPFGYQFTGIIPLAGMAAGNQIGAVTSAVGGTRFINDVQYTGNFGPLTLRAEYAFGEQAGTTSGASARAVGATYVAGPFTVAGAYTRRNPTLPAALGIPGFQDNDQWVLGAAYAAGPFRVAGGLLREEQDLGAGEAENKTAWIGGRFNFSPAAAVTAGYYHTKFEATGGVDTGRKLFIVGGTYSLSKRTTLYANIDHARFGDTPFTSAGTGGFAAAAFAEAATPAGVARKDKQTGVSVGISHSF